MRRALAITTAALAASGGAALAGTASAAPLAAYSLVAPTSVAKSGIVVRAVMVAGDTCPALVADGRRLTTIWRKPAPGTGSAFASVLVCERAMPAGVARASIGGITVPASMPRRLERMAIVSDTGCRISPWTPTQNCDDPRTWPMATIARRVAASRPDVILFPGDYFYREGACMPAQQALCAGTPPPVAGMPFDDSADAWLIDVLNPMQPMLQAAPIINTRGNHEDCYRAGNGYMLFMDPLPASWDDCAPVAGAGGALTAPDVVLPSYPIDLPVAPGRTLRLVVADSGPGSDTRVTPVSALMRPQFAAAEAMAAPARGRESWLVTHRPMFGFIGASLVPAGASRWSSTDALTAAAGHLDGYRMIVSSHIHLAQSVQMPGQAGQVVVGNGGTELETATGYDTPATGPLQGTPNAYPAPLRSWTDVRFGYAIARPGARAGRWTLRMRDLDGRQFATCALVGREVACRS